MHSDYFHHACIVSSGVVNCHWTSQVLNWKGAHNISVQTLKIDWNEYSYDEMTKNVFLCHRSGADWADQLTIPTRFSEETTSFIKSGGIPSKKARDEIIQSLSTLMLVYTDRPTPDDYSIVCRKLVEKYPTLKDKVDSSFVS